MRALAKVGAFILVFAGVIALLHFVISFFFHRDPGLLLHHGAGQFTFYILFVLNVFVFQKYVNRAGFLSLGLEAYSGWYVTVLKGWTVGVIVFVGYSALMNAFGITAFTVKYSLERVLTAFIVAFSGFGIALTEEILFRGFFFQTLLKDLPKWPAILITGIAFVFFHDLANIPNFWSIPKQMMLAGGLFCLSTLLCFAYLKSGTLYLPIGIHAGLVFAKVFFRKMNLMTTLQPDSYLFGIDGDARRGFIAWLLFLTGIFVLKYLVTDREIKNVVKQRVPAR